MNFETRFTTASTIAGARRETTSLWIFFISDREALDSCSISCEIRSYLDESAKSSDMYGALSEGRLFAVTMYPSGGSLKPGSCSNGTAGNPVHELAASPTTGVHLLDIGRSITRPLILNEMWPDRSAVSMLFTGITHGFTAVSSSSQFEARNIGNRASKVVSWPVVPVHAIDRATLSAGSPITTGPRSVEPQKTSTCPSSRMDRDTGSQSIFSRSAVSTKRSVSSAIPWVMHHATSSL